MAKTDPLAQLKDIHLPDSISLWPLAPGWYLLILLGLVLIFGLGHFIYKRKHNALAKNKALALLKSYKDTYEHDQNAQLASARISELLRRVALVYYPRAQVASIHGDAWIAFLNKTAKSVDFKPVQTMILDLPFQPEQTTDIKPLISCAEQWIKQRGVPCLN